MPAATLWLPLRERAQTWLAAAGLFVVYVATMARDLSLYDSPELTMAAVTLGLGHPPGQPLHTLLGFACSRLPLPAPAGVALASAIPGALAVVPATSLAQQLVAGVLPTRVERALPWLVAALGLHAALWEPATRVEVYALATLLALWALARLAPRARTRRDVLAASVALGLCASANPMIALCTGLVSAPSIVHDVARRALPPSALPLAALGGALGLTPYAYVPLVALRRDVLVWGAPRDAASLWHFLSLRDYVANQQLTWPMWLEHMAALVPHFALRGLAAVVLLGLAAHLALGARLAQGRLATPALLLLFASVISFNVVWSLEVPDYDGYLATALWSLAAGASALCAERWAKGQRALAAALAALLVGSAWLSPPHALARTRARDRVARALAERVLEEAPRDAVVIADIDVFSATLLYLQEAEAQRPDVVVLCHGLASSSWHWERIYARHPTLAPFALRGPGGRDARIARFLAENPSRPVRVESLAIARGLGRPACAGGLYLRTGPECAAPGAPPALAAAAQLIAVQLANVGAGSPSAAGALAQVAEGLGGALWILGEPSAAYATLLAGVPEALVPGGARDEVGLERAPRLEHALPAWQRGVALGDPGRNLFLAALLAQGAGKLELAAALAQAAARTDLPEAVMSVSSAR